MPSSLSCVKCDLVLHIRSVACEQRCYFQISFCSGSVYMASFTLVRFLFQCHCLKVPSEGLNSLYVVLMFQTEDVVFDCGLNIY